MVDTPRHRALASASRVAILRLVRASEAGLTTGEVAAATGLHLSTSRAHLDRLVTGGLLLRERSGGGVPGRPAWRYRAAAPDPAPAPYRALAAALLQHLADTDDGDDVWWAAVRAGEGWGRRLAPPPSAAVPAGAEPVEAVVRVLDDLGFSPRLTSASPEADAAPTGAVPAQPADEPPGTTEIRLHTCPFLELVADHADAMCGLHQGVARGLLAKVAPPGADAVLLPFAAPDSCVLRLRIPPAAIPSRHAGQGTRAPQRPGHRR
jgi:predicted ArsR family transcriptional regulator